MAKLTIEVADTPASLAHGLMYRKELQSDAGMLFKFPAITEANFWGKNTYIPLDIAFVNKNHQITNIDQIIPMSTKMVRSSEPCSMAIEVNAGYFNKNNIKPGCIVSLDGNLIEFKEC